MRWRWPYHQVAALVRAVLPAALIFSTPLAAEDLPDPLAAGWNGKAVCERLLEDDKQRILRCTFPAGVGHERHYHKPHFGYALSGGVMRLTDANGVREARLRTGTSFTSDGTPWHEVLNIGDTTVSYLIIETK